MTDSPENHPPLFAAPYPLPGAAKTAYVIYNPTAGSGPGRKVVAITEIASRFHAHGWNMAAIQTRFADDGGSAARLALESGADVVVAMGGDGTVNEVVQALARQDVPLGVIPVGTINVLAKELELPDDPLEAVDVIAAGRAESIDLGIANGRYFTMMIGLGYDAEVTYAIVPALKHWSGPFAYWVAGVQSFWSHKAVRARITVDGMARRRRRLRRLIYIMVVSNTGLYAGGVLKFTPEASIRDGLLDTCIVHSRRWYQALYHIVLTFFGRLRDRQQAEFFQASRLHIRTSRPFPYQLDGDPFGNTPVTVEVAPLALRVMVSPAVS